MANTTWNIYNFRLNLIRALWEADFKLTIIAPVDKYIKYRKDFPGIEHINLRSLDRDSINPWQDFKFLRELKNIYQELKPDLALHYTVKPNIYGGFAASLAQVPSIAVVTGLGYPFIHNGAIRRITKQLYRLSNQFHKKVIFENSDDHQLFVDEKLLRSNKGIAVKGCGVDIDYFSPRFCGHREKKVIFTFIGRLLYDKGVRDFVMAARTISEKLEDVEFWLVGEIDYENPSAVKEEELIQWVREPSIHYLGSVEDVRDIIAQSSCIVLPSYREGFSKVLMESMAMARPVITTKTAGCREAVNDQDNGILVPAGNIIALAQAIQDFYHLSDAMKLEMGKKGRLKAITEFSDEKISGELVEIIENVFNGEG